ncbi:hypothetical protein BDV28DRAFT_129913 [Aspergillus coremiiformis]|uniref:Uncharacterized protein n=1 Tax=Aspergillus coremiiformis TaxID=138285 RepID=A0A5N6ZBF3_9EURO|nr:hypothetical protein BDV28DRAFT_129913 [Aspergillus coremiiformis]
MHKPETYVLTGLSTSSNPSFLAPFCSGANSMFNIIDGNWLWLPLYHMRVRFHAQGSVHRLGFPETPMVMKSPPD